jgi:formylglycine-generating enzyme required for sulfatase activity
MVADTEHAPGAEAKARVFISYSRKDMAFAARLEAALKARGCEPLIDRAEIYAFEDWWKRIEGLIGKADTIVFTLSPDAVASEICAKEVAHAASLNKRFAPIVCRRVEDGAVPEALRRLNFILFDDAARFEESADALAEALQTDIGWIRQHTEYGESERRWSAGGRPRGLLLHSPSLEVAEHWLGSRPRGAPEPTKEIQAFVAASRQGARAAQRLRRLVMASMFTMLVAIILGLVGWINQQYIADQWRWWIVTRPYARVNVWPYIYSTAKEQALKPKDTFRECEAAQTKDYCPEMVVVPAGSFTMGGRSSDDQPDHPVTIPKPFAVAKLELTFDEWDTCVAYGDCPHISDFGWGRGNNPAINVTWSDAKRYVAWLSKITGKPYRLLSEAEYEFATRARKATTFPWGDTFEFNRARCAECGNIADGPSEAGLFPANDFGLFDMVGNVWEWVEDCYHSTYSTAPSDGSAWIDSGSCNDRVIRGGSYLSPAGMVASFTRSYQPAKTSKQDLGFRVARTLLAP